MKAFKIWITVMLTGLLVILLVANASALESGTCGVDGDNLVWTINDRGIMTISGNGDMQDFQYGDERWNNSIGKANELVISEGVTSIGNNAFSTAYNLHAVTLPDSLERIGINAFGSCSLLEAIIIPNNIKSIGAYAFSFCPSISNISIPASTVSIGTSAFLGCTNITTFQVDSQSSSFTSIDGVIYNKDITELIQCPAGKTTVTVPDGVTRIVDGAFDHCYELRSVSFPDDLTIIGETAFAYCDNLESITVPEKVTIISSFAFYYCSSLTDVVFLTRDVDQEITFGEDAFYNPSYGITFHCYKYTDPAIWCEQNGRQVVYLADPIRTIKIQQADLNMLCGTTVKLTVEMSPEDGAEVEWTSSAPEIVTVEDGTVTALTNGTATITATVGEVSDSIVIRTYIAATDFELSSTEMWIVIDKGSVKLDAINIKPLGAYATITWTSSNTRYATVSNTGLVTLYKPGEVIITATTENDISRQCLLHICYPVSDVYLTAPQNSILIGNDMQLTANVTMNTQSCINHLVSFTSSDESIATVDSETGLLHAIAPGRVTITATSKNDKSSSISIKVNFDFEGRQILHLPADLQEIGAEAFAGLACEAVIIPDSCTTIGERAFAGCDQLLYVYIPTSVTNISANAFDGCNEELFIDWAYDD